MSASEPHIWCLLGRKAGDNTQVRALADQLGLPWEGKTILARAWELIPHLLLKITLAGIDRKHSSPLAAPWPDIVITAGRRNEPVARWIKKQSDGKTRLVHIGRPWSPLNCWDLIVTTPQYFLPGLANVLQNQLPLHRLLPEQLSAAADRWRHDLGHLSRPRIAVLVGGDSGRFVFTEQKGTRLGQLADQLAVDSGGSLMITDSPRTPPPVSAALLHAVSVSHIHYDWSSGADNPYLGFLALADAFIVTGESMSMLGEAAAMGKPLFVFDMGDGQSAWWRFAHNYRYKPLSHRLAMALGPVRMRRDVGRVQAALVESGQAEWLTASSRLAAVNNDSGEHPGEENKKAASDATENTPTALAELEKTAAAVRRLLKPR